MAFGNSRYVMTYGVLAIIIVAMVIYLVFKGERAQAPGTNSTHTISAMFACDQGKTIQATFNNVPRNSGTSTVSLMLSDGRTMTLPQTMSADGARYSDGNPMIEGSEKFVFWNKGNTALVLENNQEKSYTGCIEVAPDPGGLPKVYESGSQGFSIRYPAGYTVDDKFYQHGVGISGVKFTVSTSTVAGTNLAPDTALIVKFLPPDKIGNEGCKADADLFWGGMGDAKFTPVTDNGVEYVVSSTTGAAAGNRYEETFYVILGTNPCTAVHYLIHYGVIDNYPPGTVHEFDKAALLKQFDAIRRTLTVGQ